MRDFTYSGHDGCRLYATTLGSGTPVVLLHGGGPDHHSLLPLAERLADRHRVLLPDIRGYGRSVCRDPALHTWTRYTQDVLALLDHEGIDAAALVGAGLGGTICLRTALAHAERVSAAVAVSLEDIEDDEAKAAEAEFLAAFAKTVADRGIEAAWEPILPAFPPIIGAMVRDAIPRSDPASIAAAGAIGGDRAFRDVSELAGIAVPVLIVPGSDSRHPAELARTAARIIPRGNVSAVAMSDEMSTVEDFADGLAPEIREFLAARH